MALSAAHRRFLWFDQGVLPAIVNFLIVGSIAWVMFGSQSTIPIWGSTSVVSELLATGFLLPLITCLINGRLVRLQVRRGQLAPLPPEQFTRGPWYEYRSPTRGVLLGLAGLLFAAATIPLVLYLWPGTEMTTTTFIVAKSLWAAAFGFAITPLIGWWGLASATLKLSQPPAEADARVS